MLIETGDSSEEEETEVESSAVVSVDLSEDMVLALSKVLRESQFNWFEFYSRIESEVLIHASTEDRDALLDAFYHQPPLMKSRKLRSHRSFQN